MVETISETTAPDSVRAEMVTLCSPEVSHCVLIFTEN